MRSRSRAGAPRRTDPVGGPAGSRPRLPAARLLRVVVVVDVVLLAATGVHEQLKGATLAVKPLVLLSLAQERTVGAWWSAAVLAAAGAGACVLAAVRVRAGHRGRRVLPAALGGLLLLGLSLDEVASVHERLIIAETAGADRAFDGAGPWLVPVAGALVLATLGLRELTGHRVAAAHWLSWAGVTCLSTILLQEDVEHTVFAGRARPPWLTILEEGTELLGSLLLLAGVLSLLRAEPPGAVRALGRAAARHRLWLAVAASTLLVAGTLAADLLLSHPVDDDQLGMPQYWTGSLAAGALAAAVSRWSRSTSGSRPARVLATTAALLAVLHGIDGLTWLLRLSGSDLPLRIGTATLLLVPALLLARAAAPVPGAVTAVAAVVVLLDGGVVGWVQVAALCAAATAWLSALPRETGQPLPTAHRRRPGPP